VSSRAACHVSNDIRERGANLGPAGATVGDKKTEQITHLREVRRINHQAPFALALDQSGLLENCQMSRKRVGEHFHFPRNLPGWQAPCAGSYEKLEYGESVRMGEGGKRSNGNY